MSAERLNKVIALHLGVGRRRADELVAGGKVLVNGQPAIMGQRVSAADTLVVNGRVIILSNQPQHQYLMLHKPVGYVCSRKQQGEAPTIYSLLPQKYHHLQPVGRLDKDSSGLLLLTNDGQFALEMTHPRFHKRKVYEVTLDAPLCADDARTIHETGVALPDGASRLALQPLDPNGRRWQVTMSEGRNRQIRRTFSALGYTVAELHRTTFGAYELGNLAPGTIQIISTPAKA